MDKIETYATNLFKYWKLLNYTVNSDSAQLERNKRKSSGGDRKKKSAAEDELLVGGRPKDRSSDDTEQSFLELLPKPRDLGGLD
ncbi:hypothetical protein RUM43_000369 [Polyplax serrata]|uniref:Uncharacterized protein n=1 Tax=Polyplax serrata TaxID=468196 RepID=A0AAN8SCD6_POLSC